MGRDIVQRAGILWIGLEKKAFVPPAEVGEEGKQLMSSGHSRPRGVRGKPGGQAPPGNAPKQRKERVSGGALRVA